MKRSEMIKDIATEIILFDHKIDFSKAQLLGNMILTRIEKEGMLPPIYQLPTTEFHGLPCPGRLVNKWEPENE